MEERMVREKNGLLGPNVQETKTPPSLTMPFFEFEDLATKFGLSPVAGPNKLLIHRERI